MARISPVSKHYHAYLVTLLPLLIFALGLILDISVVIKEEEVGEDEVLRTFLTHLSHLL